eukprot:TRINITY_DN7120_c0_g1_i1.p1 TRINITY_DN7120_c0_g1~~TRINITY_DN7120_c0_g1_i1.p1  ORF type:complete len:285 (-),score=101.37 TRINITY_DN7120_c0_g1_i1:122-976(-)
MATTWKRIPFDAVELTTEEEKERYEQSLPIEIEGNRLTIQQDEVKGPKSVGNAIWDSSLVLAKYLEKKNRSEPNFLRDKTLVELGSGCGISGIAACLLGAIVTLTDMQEILNILEKNIVSNGIREKVGGHDRCKVKELTWGETPIENFGGETFDFILGADVIYHKRAVIPFLQSAHSLSNSNTIFYLAFESHDLDATKAFWKNVEDYFSYKRIKADQLDSFYSHENITVLHLTRKELEVNPLNKNNQSELATILRNTMRQPEADDDSSEGDYCGSSDFSSDEDI